MAHLYRLIAFSILMWVGAAHALIPANSYLWGYGANGGANGGYPDSGYVFSTADAACAAQLPLMENLAEFPDAKFVGANLADAQTAQCIYSGTRWGAGPTFLRYAYKSPSGACPANSTPATGGCQCKAGFVENETKTACDPEKSRWEKACEQNMGKRIDFRADGKGLPGGCLTGINEAGSPIEGDTGGLPSSFGCSMRFVDGDQISWQDPDSKQWGTKGIARVTGGTCVATGTGGIPNDAPPDTEESDEGKKNPCPWGLVKAVNGQIVCAYDDPNGTIEGTETTGKKNPDGTTTETKKETKCEGGRCTTKTTETTKDATGTVIGTKVDEKEQTIGQKCNEDPGNKVCATTGNGDGEGGAGFSGSCASGFVVKGEDPIANAMALEQHKRNCQFFDKKPDATDETRAYDAMVEKGKQGGDQTGDLPEGSKRDYTIGPGDFDYSSAIGAQQCFTDRSVTMWGKSIAIPLSVVCPWLEILGNILVVVGSLLAARIVVRG